MTAAPVFLAFILAQRLAELALARANTRRLLGAGAREHGAGHYPLIVAVHVAWLAALAVLGWDGPVHPGWLALYGLLQLARLWVLATLGRRWTTRILTLPGEAPVTAGPFRLLRHPNYAVVAGEIAVAPLVLGLPWIALIFALLNALVLRIRIRAEAAAWRGA
ncbi:hypothetical protein GI374_02605 [Paracoccus sp. S-4012]|uniref:isoprenylcysteine carboxyl methyltransferase family protein n=1 Tax=Paracoccus sp. S-4012 TaxID=2665648 RepID=UPI0012B13C3A|nr:isoprenylcysteine carboxylmethyltransferase family protein [Paracoccus sp. S-4012]MRX49352.1 hypothetical protein [Paracoccus sp. S-4012]